MRERKTKDEEQLTSENGPEIRGFTYSLPPRSADQHQVVELSIVESIGDAGNCGTEYGSSKLEREIVEDVPMRRVQGRCGCGRHDDSDL